MFVCFLISGSAGSRLVTGTDRESAHLTNHLPVLSVGIGAVRCATFSMKTTDIAIQRRKLRIQSGGVWGDACNNFQFDILTRQGPYCPGLKVPLTLSCGTLW